MHTVKFRENIDQSVYQFHDGEKWIDTNEDLIDVLFNQWKEKKSRCREQLGSYYIYKVDEVEKLELINRIDGRY